MTWFVFNELTTYLPIVLCLVAIAT